MEGLAFGLQIRISVFAVQFVAAKVKSFLADTAGLNGDYAGAVARGVVGVKSTNSAYCNINTSLGVNLDGTGKISSAT